ncbi:MAG: hypothetical protein IT190_02015 [Microbacteriaceae bacterium]|nr:hypothetical protein [Microbacteriaceae bacterium]
MKIITLLLTLGLCVGGFVTPTAPAAVNGDTVAMVAGPAFAGVLRPGQMLLVTGTVTNTTGQTLDASTATVHISSTRMTSRTAVDRWLSDDASTPDSRTGESLGEMTIGALAAGQTRSFSITVPAASLAFLDGGTGVFPLEIHLTSEQVNLTSQRSVISWLPDGQVPRISLALATPLNAPPSTHGLLDAETLDLLTSQGGSLYEQLNTALLHTVAIGVDPMIVASIRLLGEGAPLSARDWLQRLEQAPNDIFSLGFADADQLLLHHAGLASPVEPISFPDQEEVTPVPEETLTPDGSATAPASDTEPSQDSLLAMRTTIDGLAWPARPPASEDDLGFLAAGGASRILLSSSEVTGSALFTPNVTVGNHKVTVSDDQISSLLRAASAATTESEWARAAASLTAMLAVTATQSSGAAVVATLGREQAPNSRRVGNTLSAIESLPWVNPVSLRSALTVSPVNGSISDTPVDTASVDETSFDRVPLTRDLLESEFALSQFSTVVDDSTLVTGPQRLQLLALASATWSTNFSEWSEAVRLHLTENTELLDSVHLPDSSSITLLQEKGNLPITVRNELDFPVTVFVTVHPERAILNVTDKRVKLIIEANSQAKASIPVESIANGEVRTTVSLTSSTGIAISRPTTVLLNVQAGWETTATVVLAVIVILLFGAGVWRTVRRRRGLRAERDTDEREAL